MLAQLDELTSGSEGCTYVVCGVCCPVHDPFLHTLGALTPLPLIRLCGALSEGGQV